MQHEQWSPQQISERLQLENTGKSISFNTIYRGIKSGLFNLPDLLGNRLLRRKGKHYKTKDYKENRGKFPVSNAIEQRPIEADNRMSLGDCEIDTVLGKQGKECLVTVVCRKSRFLLVKKIPNKTANYVNNALIKLLSFLPLCSITPDRGKEFAKHAEVTRVLNVDFYFPQAGCPWQRGTNENTNGLLREYFPKLKDLGQWSDDYIQYVVDKINNRPRKRSFGEAKMLELANTLRSLLRKKFAFGLTKFKNKITLKVAVADVICSQRLKYMFFHKSN